MYSGAKSARSAQADWSRIIWSSTRYGPRATGSANAARTGTLRSGTEHGRRPTKPAHATRAGSVRSGAEHGPRCLSARDEPWESTAAARTKCFPARSWNGTGSPRYIFQHDKI